MPLVLGGVLLAGYVYGALRFRDDEAQKNFEDVNGTLVPKPPSLGRTLLWPYHKLAGS